MSGLQKKNSAMGMRRVSNIDPGDEQRLYNGDNNDKRKEKQSHMNFN